MTMRIAYRHLDKSRAQALYDNDIFLHFFYGYLNGHLILKHPTITPWLHTSSYTLPPSSYLPRSPDHPTIQSDHSDQ